MKRLDVIEKAISIKNPNFIGLWNLENNDLCNEIITWFEENKVLQKQGVTSLGKISNSKKRTDIKVKPNTLDDFKFKCLKDYIKELHKCFKDYNDQWPLLKYYAKNLDIGSFNIGKYTPGGHFGKIHTERSSLQTLHRVFAWMTYLNDVEGGGETSFSNYNIKIKPEIGKTLIWPAEWTHAHSGEIVNVGEKYIITGWMHYTEDHDQNK
jgi:prolyl 4-hydroxylase